MTDHNYQAWLKREHPALVSMLSDDKLMQAAYQGGFRDSLLMVDIQTLLNVLQTKINQIG